MYIFHRACRHRIFWQLEGRGGGHGVWTRCEPPTTNQHDHVVWAHYIPFLQFIHAILTCCLFGALKMDRTFSRLMGFFCRGVVLRVPAREAGLSTSSLSSLLMVTIAFPFLLVCFCMPAPRPAPPTSDGGDSDTTMSSSLFSGPLPGIT